MATLRGASKATPLFVYPEIFSRPCHRILGGLGGDKGSKFVTQYFLLFVATCSAVFGNHRIICKGLCGKVVHLLFVHAIN